MSNYNTKRVSLIPRLSRTLWSGESRYAPRHSTLGGLSKQEWGAIATGVKVMDMTYEISNLYARLDDRQARIDSLFTRMETSIQNSIQRLSFDVADVAREERETCEKLSIGLENRYEASPENFVYYEEDGEASLQFSR